MSTDAYTKTVLTIIAACLIALAAKPMLPVAHAETVIQKVAVCDTSGAYCLHPSSPTAVKICQGNDCAEVHDGKLLTAVAN